MLSDEFVAEAVMRLLVDQLEAGRLVDPARGTEHVVGPQDDVLVPRLPGEPEALVDEPMSDAEPARPRLDEEQPELRAVVVAPAAQHAPGASSVDLGDPRLLARVRGSAEVGDDPRHEPLEVVVPPVFIGVDRAVALDDPPAVAGLEVANLDLSGRHGRHERRGDRRRLGQRPALVGRE